MLNFRRKQKKVIDEYIFGKSGRFVDGWNGNRSTKL